VLILMAEDPSEEAFFVQVLKAVGAPLDLSRRRHRLGLRETSFRILRELGTRMLLIDEINSILVGSARQQRYFLQMLRFLSNEPQIEIVCAGVPEARFALLSDPQLRSRVADTALEPWTAGPELQAFVTMLVQGLPLRQPSPVDSAQLRRLLVARSGGITLSMRRVLERAGAAAIRNDQERIDLAALEDPAIWRGIKPAADSTGRLRPAALARGQA
jgi:Bacterial TniB protein